MFCTLKFSSVCKSLTIGFLHDVTGITLHSVLGQG